MIRCEKVAINGDGKTSGDLWFMENAVQANLPSAAAGADACNQSYNVVVGWQRSSYALVHPFFFRD